MLLKQKINVLMFHHFHLNKHDKYVKNSLSLKDFEKIIKKIGKKKILSPDIWYEKFINKRLKKDEYCFTFDDGLKSQFKIALPVLKKYNIKCFWFIFTSIFQNKFDVNEINKYFYNKNFKNFYDFFLLFRNEINYLKRKNFILKSLKQKKAKNYYKQFKFYSLEERLYRYLRDQILTKEEFKIIHEKLFKKFNFKKKRIIKKLWISKEDLKKIIKNKHTLGLHSHEHDSQISNKSYFEQYSDYKKNYDYLKNFYDRKIFSSAHPFDSYDRNSSKVLKQFGITLSFSALYVKKFSLMNIPRIDHANFLKSNLKVKK